MGISKLPERTSAQQSETPGPPPSTALRAAAMIGGGYIVLAGLYIWLSGVIVAQASESIQELQYLELIKGFGFVLITGLLLFGLTFWVAKRIQEQQARHHAQQMAFLESEQRALAGLFASSFAHDINNFLMVINAELDDLSGTFMAPGQRERFDRLQHAANELQSLTRRLQDVGRQGLPGYREEFDLSEEVRRSLRLIRSHVKVKFCELEEQIEEIPNFRANRPMVSQMLANLVLNAAEAGGAGGKVLVRLEKHNGAAILEVHDSGPGIAKDRREWVFEPFHTTKKEGTGLGLLSVKACTDLHGGTIEISDSPLNGALFRLTLPDDPPTQ